jgi:uncharacterized protein (DUF1697 family)
MSPTITLDKARKDLDSVLEQADREEGVLIKKGHLFYHLHREPSERELLKSLKQSMKELKAGKARVLRSLADLD